MLRSRLDVSHARSRCRTIALHKALYPRTVQGRENTLFDWKEDDGARKNCYEGHRCDAWWASLDGQPQSDPVALNALLDWPD